ncbi:hypothetical protein [Reichenbachiella versicolor]|uniref:hypothetical protein n=1 Tax=Reichenbachiella versicolor TaxID=1821036 RepID=UPI000D6EA946|nr:hypothetical protein [Reichenbachiella versicolor]
MNYLLKPFLSTILVSFALTIVSCDEEEEKIEWANNNKVLFSASCQDGENGFSGNERECDCLADRVSTIISYDNLIDNSYEMSSDEKEALSTAMRQCGVSLAF